MLLGAVNVFAQNEMTQRGSIPEELLRPRREEAPRYPIDTVIGELGQGNAPAEAYAVAQKVAAALLAGNMDAAILAPVGAVFLESCMTMLAPVSPRSYRLGSGREEPDGSVSFLIRFIGREQGITGELYIRLEQPRPQPVPEARPTVIEADKDENEGDDSAAAEMGEDETIAAEQIVESPPEPEPEPEQAPAPVNVPAAKVWLFEDLILEEPRTREEENNDSRHRFDFPPYERFF